MNDELEELLRPSHEPAPSESGQQLILQKSLQQLHRTRRLRQVQQIALWTVVFALGMSASWLLMPSAKEVAQSTPTQVTPQQQAPPLLTAAQLELEAEKANDTALCAKYYREAGDKFLEAQDLRSALRCYRLHLSEGGTAVRSILANDTWLLMDLKTAHLKGERQ